MVKGGVDMEQKQYIVPEKIIDTKEENLLLSLTESYQKLLEPSLAGKLAEKVGSIIPDKIKDFSSQIMEKASDTDIFVKALEVVGKSFAILEEYAAKVTLSEAEILKQINRISSDNQITTMDEICLIRSYELSKIVNKNKFTDVIAALVEGGATGAAGFAGIPFNLALSTFLFYRAVQSVALFYGYDVKNDPAELSIASEVFMNALNPSVANGSELSGAVAKIMLFTTATSVKQTVKKGWTAMAEHGGVHLLLAQMRALANNAAKKAIEKAVKKSLEKTAFTEVLEQLGKKMTQKSLGKAIPYIGAFFGATIDTAQMIQIIKYADIFYQKRFILEKEHRISMLLDYSTGDVNPRIEEMEGHFKELSGKE